MNHFLTLLKSRGITTPPTEDVRAIGIDLGTTISTVSEITWQAGQEFPEPVRTIDVDQETVAGRHTSPMVPSIVCVQQDGTLVGEGAKVLRGRMADNSFGLVVRLYCDVSPLNKTARRIEIYREKRLLNEALSSDRPFR